MSDLPRSTAAMPPTGSAPHPTPWPSPADIDRVAELPRGDDPLGVGRWSQSRAVEWYGRQSWIVGCNYVPAYAVNQLEMWQPETFDLSAIDAELELASSVGFNTVRVFLHDLLWSRSAVLVDHLDRFLEVAARRGVAVIPVLLEGVWQNYAHLGPQPDPVPGIHNSQWVQSPNAKSVVDPAQWPRLEEYVCGVLDRFADDERILLWDLYNEPGNEGLIGNALPLTEAVFRWARSIEVVHPLTSGIWETRPEFLELTRFQLLASDVLTFHQYADVASLDRLIRALQVYERPLLCTEFLARTLDSNFASHLPLMRRERVGALNWGLVAGRTQTMFAWDSPRDAPEPQVWFHDIFRPDGQPYDAEEVRLIRQTAAGEDGQPTAARSGNLVE